MSFASTTPNPLTSIVDNQGENTLLRAINKITVDGRELWVATAFFSLDALNLVGENLLKADRIRLLYGGEANPRQRKAIVDALRHRSEEDLLEDRKADPLLSGLKHAKALIESGRLEARVYVRENFHAKLYISHRKGEPPISSVVGSGNFTRSGLTRNVELNLKTQEEQTEKLVAWYEERWAEAEADDITQVLLEEIERHLKLYDPYAIYLRALTSWGEHYQGGLVDPHALAVRDQLDPHQLLGYQRALEILERESGVMICDGVGLGKSFIALALMEHFCRLKKNVLLVAPKSIMEASWSYYLATYLDEFRQPFGTIYEKNMTDFGFNVESGEDDNATQARKINEFGKLVDRVDVVVVDESHNFRTTNAQRYKNLRQLVKEVSPDPTKRKLVILLTATPINTRYQDLSAQLALVARDSGTVSGFTTAKITAAAKDLDLSARKDAPDQGQLELGLTELKEDEVLRRVLEAVVIQRKRATCIKLAEATGKSLVFPVRKAPEAQTYELSESWKRVVQTATEHFEPIAVALRKMKAEYKKADTLGVQLTPLKLPSKAQGIRFAAFLPEQYRNKGEITRKEYQSEVFLAGLVFTNTMKQLESSPAAFQGILQSLGASLAARLAYVIGSSAGGDIESHTGWINSEINALAYDDEDTDFAEGEDADLNGDELDAWLAKAVSVRHLKHKLADFTSATHDVARWRRDILHDLNLLKEIHRETLVARQHVDFKLEIVAKMLRERVEKGERVVVFTQSQRTSFYLEKQLQNKIDGASIARIDSNVKQETRAGILHAFCPKYNPAPPSRQREKVDVLICTDVLSEGVNMQEANCILNYDIHWNPVRLIQRIGRVDRRLDPEKSPEPHEFSIINFLPPEEINEIIDLVNTVENRTGQINKTLGIDQAFFKSTDPTDTLKEFNKMVDGEPTLLDQANERYVATVAQPDPELAAVIQQLPLGAFGVWSNAPADGLFALFEMHGSPKLAAADADAYKSILGRPVLALQYSNGFTSDAARILEILGQTIKEEKSGDPSDSLTLQQTLKAMRNKVSQSFRDINLVSTIQPKLICWMELRK